jgi:P-type Ca2+ transporter type 2C
MHSFAPALQDALSSLLHLGGAVVFFALTPRLLREARGWPARLSCGVFVAAVLGQLAASALYHALPFGDERAIAQRLDHAGIFLLIAGTFTPCHVIMFKGFMRWGVLSLVWLFALTSLVVKIAYFDELPESGGLVLYLAIGWIGIVSGIAALKLHGWRFVAPVLYGGLVYTGGSLLDLARWPILPGDYVTPHDLFHVAVLGGIALHWRFIARLAAR